MNAKHGISLITLVVTIMVMLILIGIVGKYSLENIREANNAVIDREFASVRDFVLNVQSKMLVGEFEIDLNKYSDIELRTSLLNIVAADKLSDSEIRNINEVNLEDIHPNYKYYYFDAETTDYFENRKLCDDNIRVQDVKNDYIINFYTGTVIGLYADTVKVDGLIKGKAEIIAETTL